MEQIRERVHEGLRAFPRIGMGVGGFLFGDQQHGKIRLLDSIAIPCSHANGPSFNLTEAERHDARQLLAEAAGTPIGWYCSKTRGEAALNEFDKTFFEDLLPGQGKIALVAKPSLAAPMRAVFYVRDANGAVVKSVECDVDSWHPEAPKAVEPAPAATPPTALPASSTFPGLFGAHAVEPSQPPRAKKFVWTVAAAAFVAAVGALFVTQNFWMPRPPLTLNSSESNGSLTIRWNPRAVRGIDHAELNVNDGGVFQTILLDKSRLNSGFLVYIPNSQRVTAKLDAAGTTAITAWFAPTAPNAAAGVLSTAAAQKSNDVLPASSSNPGSTAH